MVLISYTSMFIVITTLWLAVRIICSIRAEKLRWKRELQLLPVYVCLVVVARFTFFPFGKVDGQIRPLLLDFDRILPPRLNFLPFVYLFDYPQLREALLNLIGNTAMFIPLGIVWPSVFKKLDAPWKVIAAGVGFSACIEILQLPFYDRVTDIDDLILNSAGYLIGYGIYLLAGKLGKILRARKISS